MINVDTKTKKVKIQELNNRHSFLKQFLILSGVTLWGFILVKLIWAISTYDWCLTFYGTSCLQGLTNIFGQIRMEVSIRHYAQILTNNYIIDSRGLPRKQVCESLCILGSPLLFVRCGNYLEIKLWINSIDNNI